MDVVTNLTKAAIAFLFFTFSPSIMLLSGASAVGLAVVHRVLFTDKQTKQYTTLFGLPTRFSDDYSLIGNLLEYITLIAVWFGVYAGCLFGWSYYFTNYAAH
jgi:hypothetical protein